MSAAIIITVTEQDPIGTFHERPHPMFAACLLIVEKTLVSQVWPESHKLAQELMTEEMWNLVTKNIS